MACSLHAPVHFVPMPLGGTGFRGLSRVLNILDDNGNRALDKYEIDNGLQTYGIVLHPSEIDIVMASFDKDGNGQITVREFMNVLRGPMADYRKGLVRMAYQMLDVDGSGVVHFDEIRQLYDVKKHPDVLSGTKTPDMVYYSTFHSTYGSVQAPPPPNYMDEGFWELMIPYSSQVV